MTRFEGLPVLGRGRLPPSDFDLDLEAHEEPDIGACYRRSRTLGKGEALNDDRISLGRLAYASSIHDAMTGFGSSYRVFQDVAFLRRVRDDLRHIRQQRPTHHVDLADLPERLGRSEATPAQLVGEYYWISITREVETPGPEI